MINDNNRMNQILKNSRFQEYVRKNERSEETRKFCCHGLQHSLDVARIAYIINLEQGLGFAKDVIYGTALLHDIGKWQEYESGISHDAASAVLAREILAECDYTECEAVQMEDAILQHRKEKQPQNNTLHHLLYYADKKSRSCFSCKAADECYWPAEKRNSYIFY